MDELGTAPLHVVPPVGLLLLFPGPLTTDLEHHRSSISTFTFSPSAGRFTLITCASEFSFQWMLGLAMAIVLLAELGALATATKPSNGSKMSREKGSKMLLRPPINAIDKGLIFELEIAGSGNSNQHR
ncbi:hypothetical protein RJ640_017526 [Escallonia rubra]|uniref:Uncharacterized protein n=1 Tax=Escallonia rubra TaxID=112253 RepID=A0AA88UKT1_9ASTE|nr:hypothetical protein RJ640_017526 [Escallonia rubra]